MPLSKRDRENLRALCAELHPDDGVDPRNDKKRAAARQQRNDWKLQQLCKQVMGALHLELMSETSKTEMRVAGVEPAPNAGRLRVIVAITNSESRDSAMEILELRKGAMRCEVARAIARKRAPELTFSVIVEEVRDD